MLRIVLEKTLRLILITLGVALMYPGNAMGKTPAEAKSKNDLGFRFQWDEPSKTGVCKNDRGEEGYNPHFVGPCGDMRGMKLGRVKLNGADLSGAILDGLDLRNAQLNGAILVGVKARGTDFSKAYLNGAKLYSADVSGAVLDRTELNGAYLDNADLSGAVVIHAQMHGAQMSHANLAGTKINSPMDTANVRGAIVAIGTELPFGIKEASARGMYGMNIQGLADYKTVEKNRLPASNGK
ncbi:MAG: pentapeptide repeat-containing protein [Pseudobdellovibrionaceae bacterium]|nr:pentapeptide repeat-containing protein [Bdellovibrionales bacterium]USN47560.1 MAG: pentapeptide repeat-containing protein [Pseudobdellovibrionaceae bacterium]